MTDMNKNDEWKQQDENVEPFNDYREEAAAEVVPLEQHRKSEGEAEEQDRRVVKNHSVGIFALVLSILSLLIMPIILGAAGIITGFYARGRDSQTLGNWAIGIGAISVITSLFFSRFL